MILNILKRKILIKTNMNQLQKNLYLMHYMNICVEGEFCGNVCNGIIQKSLHRENFI